ncbi:MAG: hypothetical protein U1A77_07375 [Pirellulales bacterium]
MVDHAVPPHSLHDRISMSASGSKSLPAIGFLTVCEHAEQGCFGGLLVLNANGRPLEFHCTAPVKTNRAQEILYGPTLRRYLFGEQLGPALLGKLKVEPLIVCTDTSAMLAVREFYSSPVLLVLNDSTAPASDESWERFRLGATHVAIESEWHDDRAEVLRRWEPYVGRIDLYEPFTRIRDAIDEARKAA